VATARANRILSGTGGTVLFNSGTSNAITDTGTGIFISGAVGNVTVQADTELTGTEGIDINGGSGTFTFTDTDINLTGAGVALDVNGGTSNIMFQAASSITHSVNSGAAVSVSGGHTVGTVDIDGTIDTSGFNLGLQFNNADGIYRIDGIATLSGQLGIDISNGSDGTFTFTNMSITNTGADAFRVTGGGGNINWIAGSLVNNNNNSVEIVGRTGGAITIGATVNDTGEGMRFNTNFGGSTTFSNNVTLNTGATIAVDVTASAAHGS
jgi:hypothetical protein